MKKISQSFSVGFTYDVLFTENAFAPENTLLIDLLNNAKSAESVKVSVVIDEAVIHHHKNLAAEISSYFSSHKNIIYNGDPLIVSGGEPAKNSFENFHRILEKINNEKIDRHSFLIAIGGGAVLDLAGFIAAIGHRGIRHIRIPTTVLSQNDSGVGVKNGINYFDKKNFIGCFAPPYAVINDAAFLTTLNNKDWKSGISEAVKVALIKDKAFFEWLDENAIALNSRNLPVMNHLIYKCAEMHLEHISTAGDPFEQGSSRPLDFGHWSAHKLEQLTHFTLRHGEAVAIGIALDATYSYVSGFLGENEWKYIISVLKKLELHIFHPLLLDDSNKINGELVKGLEEFREHLGGRLTIMLLGEAGKGFEVNEMDIDNVEKAALILKEESEK